VNANTDGIVAYLNVLHTHRELVAETYHRNSITLTTENQGAIRKLQQQRILSPYLQDEFRLAPSLTRHLDEVFQRQRNYAISSNFDEQFNRLLHLADEYQKASHENRSDDRDNYEDDFNTGVFELGESIASGLLLLRTLTDNRFAHVNTLAEKQRQNAYYIKQAEKLLEALMALQTTGVIELLNSSTLLAPLQRVYQHQLLSPLPEWRASLLDISATLRNYLYRLRQIEPEAKRLRTFAHFLQRNPDYQPPDVEDLPQQLPLWAQRFTGISVKTHPDLSHNTVREALAEIARAIPATTVKITREREAGRLVAGGEEKTVITLQPKPVQIAFQHYLQAARESLQPLSALHWIRQQTSVNLPEDEAWILYVLHAVQVLYTNDTNTANTLVMQRVEAPLAHRYSGNIVVMDMQLWKKA
jgi:hypothetical protein